jgi:hypothetical protein
MQQIEDTDVYTDGVVKYKKNAEGNLAIYIEEKIEVPVIDENAIIVSLDQQVTLKPV